MKYTIGLIAIALIMASCAKEEKKEETQIDNREVYIEIADEISADSTIENGEIIALICKDFLDVKHAPALEALNKERVLELFKVSALNSELLVEINYGKNPERLLYEKEVFIISESNNIVHRTLIPGTMWENGVIDVVDWDQDGFKDLRFRIEQKNNTSGVSNEMEMIYQYSDENLLSKVFEISNEHRNCSSSMSEKWNYVARSYKLESGRKITVWENFYMIDCEEYERMGKISKLKTISKESYLMAWSKEKGMYVKV